MFNAIKTAVMAGLVGITALSAVPASADGIYLKLGDGDARIGVTDGESSRLHRRHDRRQEYRDDVYQDEQYGDERPRDEFRRSERRGCSPERALNKAERIGVHRARIVDVSRRTISIVGRSHGDRVQITFARAPSCPIIG